MKTLKVLSFFPARRALRVAVPAFVALMLASVAFIPARAQFTGPALQPSTSAPTALIPTTDPALLYPTASDVVLLSGDLLLVKVFGPGDYTASVRIGTEGNVRLPLIGIVPLQGITVNRAEDLIAERLRVAGMFRDPQVSVQVVEGPSSSVTLLGELHGIYPIVGQRRLLDVVSLAGGLPASASHVITINRPGVKQPIVVNLGTDPSQTAAADIPIFPGDTIIVPRVGVVYLLGAFKTQGAVPIVGNSPLTLLQIASLSGGPTSDAKVDDLRIIRTTGGTRTFVKVDIKRVLYGKDPDPVLQADDILFLPDSALKKVILGSGLQVLISVTSLLLNVLTFSSVR